MPNADMQYSTRMFRIYIIICNDGHIPYKIIKYLSESKLGKDFPRKMSNFGGNKNSCHDIFRTLFRSHTGSLRADNIQMAASVHFILCHDSGTIEKC